MSDKIFTTYLHDLSYKPFWLFRICKTTSSIAFYHQDTNIKFAIYVTFFEY